jgi:hypothetical protein
MPLPRIRIALAAAAFIGAIAVYGYGIARSPLLNAETRAQQQVLARFALQQASPDEVRALAEAYWQRNPDVAQDSFFGRNGKMGIFGAREHYDRHGRKEGRRWGL